MDILIAEDDLTSRSLLTAVLTRLGYSVAVKKDGVEAWKAMQQSDCPRLVILDRQMPGLNGDEICNLARKNKKIRQPYIILLTVRGEKHDVVEGLEAGADDYISKPYNTEELRARIEVGRRVVGLQNALEERISELEQALAEIKTLRGIVPICCYCKKVRDDKNYWQMVEQYVSDHSYAMFSHSICPECYEKYTKPELEAMDDET